MTTATTLALQDGPAITQHTGAAAGLRALGQQLMRLVSNTPSPDPTVWECRWSVAGNAHLGHARITAQSAEEAIEQVEATAGPGLSMLCVERADTQASRGAA